MDDTARIPQTLPTTKTDAVLSYCILKYFTWKASEPTFATTEIEKPVCLLPTGGLLYTRDSSNLQYVTSASMVLLIYSKILDAAKIQGVQCGSAHFSPSQIKAFAKTQVDICTWCKNKTPFSRFLAFEALKCYFYTKN